MTGGSTEIINTWENLQIITDLIFFFVVQKSLFYGLELIKGFVKI